MGQRQHRPQRKENIDFCPICGAALVRVTGPPAALIGVIGEYPGDDELEELAPFVGPSGNVLRTELRRLQIDLDDCRVTNMWSHPPTEKNDPDYRWNAQRALAAVAKCEIVLLLGSEVTKAILGEIVSNVGGLVLRSNVLPGKKIIAAPNPTAVMRGTLGEFRTALEVLADEKKKME